MSNFQFVPAYYEWHFIDRRGNVLLNMADPADSIAQCDSIATATQFCEDFIDTTIMFLEDAPSDINGNTLRQLERLPADAARIMAKALYDYYIAA